MSSWTPPNPKTFDWYLSACDCYDAGKPNPPITVEPCQGYYRATLYKGGEYRPFVYFWENDKLYLQVGDDISGTIYDETMELPNKQTIREAWPMVSKRPVRLEKYDYYCKNGRWPDSSEAIYEAATNYPPPGTHPDSFANLQFMLSPLLTEADQMIAKGAAPDKETAQRANDLHNRLIEYFKWLENKQTLKERIERDPDMTPQVKAGYATYARVFTNFRTLLGQCEIYKSLKSIVIEPYLKKVKAEATAKGEPPPTKVLSGGVGGRAVGLREQPKKAVFTDYADALLHFANHEEIVATVQKLANAMARQGIAAPGCKIVSGEESAA
jgi:hypothetical protein